MFASQVNGVTVIFNIAVFVPEVHDIETLVLKIRQKKKYCFGVNNCKLGVKYFLLGAKMSRPIRNDGKDDVDLPDDIINILSKKCLPWLSKTNVFLNRFLITDWISRRKALIIVYTLMEYQYFSHSKTWCPARN